MCFSRVVVACCPGTCFKALISHIEGYNVIKLSTVISARYITINIQDCVQRVPVFFIHTERSADFFRSVSVTCW